MANELETTTLCKVPSFEQRRDNVEGVMVDSAILPANLKRIVVSFQWKDQGSAHNPHCFVCNGSRVLYSYQVSTGWGNQKGIVFVRVKRQLKCIFEWSAEFGIAPHQWTAQVKTLDAAGVKAGDVVQVRPQTNW